MGESEGECPDHGTCLVSLLTCNGESEELKKPTANSKALDTPAAILVTSEVWETLGELEEADDELEDPGHAGGDNGGLEEVGHELLDLGDVGVS